MLVDLRKLVLITALLQLVTDSEAQNCLLATNGNRPLPNFVRPSSTSKFRGNPIQAIITSYRFNCCGVITQWGAFVHRGGDTFNGTYSITFQVWRPNSPSPVDTDGCYAIAGVNHFQNIVLNSNNRGLIRETSPANETIAVQPGDVIGFYLTNTRDKEDNGIQFADEGDNADPYEDEAVWYAIGTISGSNPSCLFPVGSDRTLSLSTNLAPLITASILSSNCPQSSSTMAILPTTTTPIPTPIPSPSSNTNVANSEFTMIESQTVTRVTVTPSPIQPTGSGFDNGGESIELIAGIATPAVVLLVLGVMVIIIISVCVAKKRSFKQPQENTEVVSYSGIKQTGGDQTESEPFYDTVDSSNVLSISKNEAYGKFEEANSTTEAEQSNFKDPPTLQYSTYGGTPTITTTNEEQNYYVNEGLNNPVIQTTQNEAYGDITGQISSSRVTGSLDDTSIPTTRNEAYTSVSTNTERVDTEETYDYVRSVP